jgi:hypothetical protein
MSSVPIMQIRHDTKDRWWVAATWPDGRREDVKGFATESEANEWIANELQTWLDERKEERV